MTSKVCSPGATDNVSGVLPFATPAALTSAPVGSDSIVTAVTAAEGQVCRGRDVGACWSAGERGPVSVKKASSESAGAGAAALLRVQSPGRVNIRNIVGPRAAPR